MTHPLLAAALVGVGGMAGSISRYGLSVFCRRFAIAWPGGTLAANLLGCLLIGAIAALSERTAAVSPAARLLLATGFCGGFTTLSSLVYEVLQLLRAGEYLHGTLYLTVTLLGAIVAFLLGALGVRFLVHTVGGIWN